MKISQMAVTGKSYCDFFVYTQFGIHQERIIFDPIIWNKILKKLQHFWHNYLAPEINVQTLKTSSEIVSLNDPKKTLLINYILTVTKQMVASLLHSQSKTKV